MSKPIIKFLTDPPLLLNCVEHKSIQMEITPRAEGASKIVLSLAANSCFFETGEKEFTVDVPNDDNVDKVQVDIPLKMQTEDEDIFFLLLSAHGINSGNERSFTKRIEAEIDGNLTAVVPDDDDDDNDSA